MKFPDHLQTEGIENFGPIKRKSCNGISCFQLNCVVGHDALGEYQIQGNRQWVLYIRGFGSGIIEKTCKLRDSLEKENVVIHLREGGLIPYNIDEPVQDISGLDGSENEERSSYDVFMRTDSIITGVSLGFIESVNAEATYSQPGKDDIVKQLTIEST